MSDGSQNQRRISDICFYIDADLTVAEGNRSFLRFFDTPTENINLKDYLSSHEAKHLKSCLKHMRKSAEPSYFVASIHVLSFTFVSLLQISQDDAHPGLFRIDLSDFSYAREHTESTLRRMRVYEALIHNYDSHFFVYDDGKLILSNTKNIARILEEPVAIAKSKFIEYFKIDIEDFQTTFQFDLFFSDLVALTSPKTYKFHTLDNGFLTISTNEVQMREKNMIVGLISNGSDVILTENAFSARNDGMTNLLNKQAITDLAKNRVDVVRTPCTLFIIDIDHFKDFNDNFGHSFGDTIIVTLANCLKDAVNGIGTAGRIGGDEFLCIIDATDEDTVRSVARNIKLGLQWAIPADNVDALVTCSIGIARFPDNAKSYDELFKTADKCLYIAKSRGRNCYIIYNEDKHGIIQMPDATSKQNEKGTQLMECADAEIAIMRTFLQKEEGYIKKMLEMLLDYMGVHCISVYTWHDSKIENPYVVGRREEDFRINRLSDPVYFRNFNSSNFLHMDSTTVLDTVDRENFRMYATADINSTIEVLCKDENGANKVLVCFDIYRPARTFEQSRVVFALIASRLLGETL